MTNIFPIDFEEKLTMAQDDYILFSDSEDGNKIKKAQYKNLKGEKGDPGTPGQDGEDGVSATITVGSTTTGTPGSSASVTNSGTSSAAILDFTIPQGAKGEPGEDGQDGADGAAATITVGTTTTLPAGSSATVTNVGTSQDAILNFGIPKGDAGTGSGDVSGPASSTDGDVAIFDGATGKLIKDGSVALSTLSSGASLAATAIQPGDNISDLNNDSGFITGITSGDVTAALGYTPYNSTNPAGYTTNIGDVIGPASSVDGHIAVFDGATGKIIKDGGAVPEGNVKSFTLSSTSDLANAQAAYDWYDDGNVAIIIYNDKEYFFDYATENNAYWSVANEVAYDTVSATGIQRAALQLALSSGSVTAITTLNLSVNDLKVLRTDKNYGTPYTPQYDGSPATKKYVDDSVADLMGLGKFLSLWDASTGLPISFPLSTPYTYTTGDYFLVETVSSATPPVNYKPNGSSYTGTASSTSESGELEVGDIYIYDGSTWLLQLNHGKTVSFSEIAGSPSDNTALGNALGAKQDSLTLPATPTQGHLVTWGADNETLADGGAVPTGFAPGGTATTGYVVTKTANGYEWSAPTEPTVVSDDSGVTYHITVSNSDPTSGTASNIITLVI